MATRWAARAVDAGHFLHPLTHAFLRAWGGVGRLAKQLPTLAEEACLRPVGQKAHVPDTHETLGQHMQQKAPDALAGLAWHRLHTIAVATVAGGEAALAITHIDNTVVSNGAPGCLAADIIQNLCRAPKGWLGVDDPVLAGQWLVERREALGYVQGCRLLGDRQGAGGPGVVQRLEALAAEDRPQRPDRAEEAGISRDPRLAVRRQRTGRDDAVDLAMGPQRLVPGVQDSGAADRPAEVTLTQLLARLAGSGAQERS